MGLAVRRRVVKLLRLPLALAICIVWLVRHFSSPSSPDSHASRLVASRPSQHAETPSLGPDWHAAHEAVDEVHVAVIFDENRLDYGLQVLRSAAHFTNLVHAHVVAPPALHGNVKQELRGTTGLGLSLYDHSLCHGLTRIVRAFSNPTIHVSAHCKVFLADIITDASLVLYLDNDATAVDDLSRCYGPLPSGVEFAMSVDAGDVCQIHPERCWPMSLEFVPSGNLRCGTAPSLYDATRYGDEGSFCPKEGEPEPAQVNGGVILMDLDRMRRSGFTTRYVQATASSFRLADSMVATWGEQDFINSFIRLYPSTFSLLPCGCNYQYSAVRKEIKCGGQPVHIVHAWSSSVKRRSADPYNQLFYHFLLPSRQFPLPILPSSSPSVAESPNVTEMLSLNVNCVQQPYLCSSPPLNAHWGDPVYILTRTSGRPLYFQESLASIRSQTYPVIRHLVVTDDPASTSYLRDIPHTLVPSRANDFDADEVCRKCGHLAMPGAGSCAAAPFLGMPGRQTFLACYCDTAYPMNLHMNALFDLVAAAKEPGWIIILDDDNILAHERVISELILDVASADQLLLFRSMLGRVTPSPRNEFKSFVERGDIDASNYMFHSSHIEAARWDGRRCADWRSINALSKRLHVQWSNTTAILAHPLRAKLGGLGKRGDLASSVDVIVNVHASSVDALWNRDSISDYCSYSTVVGRVWIAWKHSSRAPSDLPSCAQLLPHDSDLSSLGKLSEADNILVIDSDIAITQDAIFCLLNHVLQDASKSTVAGAFATTPGAESAALYRCLMLPRSVLPSIGTGTSASCPYSSLNLDRLRVSAVQVGLPPDSLRSVACSSAPFAPFFQLESCGVEETDTLARRRHREQLSVPQIKQSHCLERGHIAPPLHKPPTSTKTTSQLQTPLRCPRLPPSRTGVARDVQEFCPDAKDVDWVEAVATMPICGQSGNDGNHEALMQSAKFQCGAWCIWDLRTSQQRGWYKMPTCFRPLRPRDIVCERWFASRPSIQL